MSSIHTLKVKHFPFVSLHRCGFDMWEKMGNRKGQWNIELAAVETTYVGAYDLKEKARIIKSQLGLHGEDPSKYQSRVGKNKERDSSFAPSIWEGTVGFMSSHWVNKNSQKEPKSYRFGTGIYHNTSNLFLVDDVFEWAYRRIEAKDIRSAHDIIATIVRGELEL